EFGRANDVRQVKKIPAGHLSTVAQIGILGKRIVFPASRSLDGLPAPDPCCSIEIEETARKMPRAVLDHEMAIEDDGFYLRQQRVFAIDMAPARLDHSNL